MQDDPPQGKPSKWARAVVSGEQILVCPVCQSEQPDWATAAESCPNCGYNKLSLKLGFRVCPKCGHSWE